MATDNDTLLERLYQFVGEELHFHPLVDVQPNLTGGIHDTPALAVAVHSEKGAPAIVLDASYRRWPADELIDTFCHEVAHHRLGHVHTAARFGVKVQPGAWTRAGLLAYERNERAAEQNAKAYAKRFEAWQQQLLLAQIQNDLQEIRQMLVAAGRLPARGKAK